MHHHYKEIKEKLIVTGSNSAIIPLRTKFRPKKVHAFFITPECHPQPGCHPIIHDSLCVDLVELPHQWAIRLVWRVKHPREIEWIAVIRV